MSVKPHARHQLFLEALGTPQKLCTFTAVTLQKLSCTEICRALQSWVFRNTEHICQLASLELWRGVQQSCTFDQRKVYHAIVRGKETNFQTLSGLAASGAKRMGCGWGNCFSESHLRVFPSVLALTLHLIISYFCTHFLASPPAQFFNFEFP